MPRPFLIPMSHLSDVQQHLFNVLERNARRLLQEACTLFDAGSFGSAKSLAVLSLEECGKFSMLAFDCNLEDRELAASVRRRYRSHPFKQLHSVLMLGGLTFRHAAQEIVSKGSQPITAESLIIAHAAVTDEPEKYPELVEASRAVEHALASLTDQWMRETGWLQLAERIRSKVVDAEKQNGFYVDFEPESATVMNDPAFTTAEQAQEYIELAKAAIDCFLTD
jgi:AbiV family abortive infection protein